MAFIEGAVAFIGGAVTFVEGTVTFVGEGAVTSVGGAVTSVGEGSSAVGRSFKTAGVRVGDKPNLRRRLITYELKGPLMLIYSLISLSNYSIRLSL